ncbi:MAG: ribosomal protein L7/L12 [Actinomycetota bacterium]|nr:ribosomal protein L7/L12 [Actinomycetota bacterium]
MKKLNHSDNDRGGMLLDTGRMYEIDREHSLNEMYLYATADAIRLVSLWCGEWEQAQRDALHFDPAGARALGEALIDAADAVEQHTPRWRSNAERVDPQPALDRLMRERIAADAADQQARLNELLDDEPFAEDIRAMLDIAETASQATPTPTRRTPTQKRAANGRFVKSPASTIKDLNAKFDTFLSSVATIDASAKFNVVLQDAGDKKIGVIKVLREAFHDRGQELSLIDAKTIVDTTPSAVITGAGKGAADALAHRIAEAGGTASVAPAAESD